MKKLSLSLVVVTALLIGGFMFLGLAEAGPEKCLSDCAGCDDPIVREICADRECARRTSEGSNQVGEACSGQLQGQIESHIRCSTTCKKGDDDSGFMDI